MPTSFDFSTWNKKLEDISVLEPFRQLLEGWFTKEDEYHREERRKAGQEGYTRRPNIGLYLPGNRLTRRPNVGLYLPGTSLTLAVRPIYQKTNKSIDPANMVVEVVGPPVLASIYLSPKKASWRTVRVAHAEEVFDALVDMTHRMVLDPFGVFRGSLKCCRCRRKLTDATSRTRGVGPECIHRFMYFGLQKDKVCGSLGYQ